MLDAGGKRVAHPLGTTGLDLEVLLSPSASCSSPRPIEEQSVARLFPFREGNTDRWVALAGPASHLRVNGIPLAALGMRVLADRDEVSLPGVGSTYFSTEVRAGVVQFPGAERAVFCGRCRQAIQAGSPAVRCPHCGIWYDQSEELPCWRYSATCAYCENSTALDAGFSWTPAE